MYGTRISVFETFLVMNMGSMSALCHQDRADSDGANRKSCGHGERAVGMGWGGGWCRSTAVTAETAGAAGSNTGLSRSVQYYLPI
jgi:hypothetical protein